MKRYFHSTGGKPSEGPHSLEELAELFGEGTIGRETVVLEEGSSDAWKQIGEVMVIEMVPEPEPISVPPISNPAPKKSASSLPAIIQEEFSGVSETQSFEGTYKVVVLSTGCFSGTLNPVKLQDVLNSHAKKGWKFSKSIKEEKRIMVLLKREAHFLIFEKSSK